MSFELVILGSNSAIPANGRHPTSQILNHHHSCFLIDCGEGTQMRMDASRIKRSRIDHIFISHLHGDHYFGLIGLITSFHLLNREKPLHIYCPKELEGIIQMQLRFSNTGLPFDLNFHFLHFEKAERILENDVLTVETIIMNHRIPCAGFLFREKPMLRNMIPEKITKYKIPHSKIPGIKAGEDFISENGEVIPNHLLTLSPSSPRSYAFCADTIYTESVIDQIKDVDLLYHEATFTEESKDRAVTTMHSTAKEAAMIASKANVKKLMIGHYSAKYKSLENHLTEAKEFFENTILAEEGMTYHIGD